jgi:hypothetical protein
LYWKEKNKKITKNESGIRITLLKN